MKEKQNILHNISPMKAILYGYCLIILVGTLLLTLPISSRSGQWTPVTDCFFTATSATCVTGLIRYDTYTYWTMFGQLVILSMIQIGGVGFMTIAILIMVATRRKISLNQRALMQSSVSAPQLGGIVRMTKFIALGTAVIEAIGAVLLSFDFIPRFGWAKGIYFSIFHSISAFCNAGFDLMGGTTGKFSSLTGLADNWYVNVIIMSLIIIGGLGFFVWHDVLTQHFHFSKLKLHSKMVLSVSMAVMFIGAAVIFLTEHGHEAYEGMALNEQILASLFQSVTSRTAGFNTANLSKMTDAGIFVMTCLMFVGGSPGTTAGGIKTTTFWVLCISIFTTFFHKKNVEAFGRRMDEHITRTASCVFMIYLLMTCSVAVIISSIENVPLVATLCESVSAMATVGVTVGITPSLGMVSKLLLAFLMLCGRVGSVTMLLAFSSDKKVTNSSLPLEQVQVG